MSFQCPHGVRYNIPVGRGGIESHNVFTWCGRINTSVFLLEVSREYVFCGWGCRPVYLRKNHAKVKMGQKIFFHQAHQVNFQKKTHTQGLNCSLQKTTWGCSFFERWPDLLLKASWNCCFSSNLYNKKTNSWPTKIGGSFKEVVVGSFSNISESQGTKHPARVKLTTGEKTGWGETS